MGILDRPFATKPAKLTLSCRLNKNYALVFSNIVVTPFLGLSTHDKTYLDKLFKEGHLKDGIYCLAGYPAKGPRAMMKIGFINDLSVYVKDVDRRKAADAFFYEVSTGFVGDILDLIETRQGTKTKGGGFRDVLKLFKKQRNRTSAYLEFKDTREKEMGSNLYS